MHQSSADFSGRFWPKGKSNKMFNIMSTKSVIFKFSLWGGGGPTAPPPVPRLRKPLPAPSLNTVSQNLTLTAIHQIKMCGPQLTAKAVTKFFCMQSDAWGHLKKMVLYNDRVFKMVTPHLLLTTSIYNHTHWMNSRHKICYSKLNWSP
jgi:hypothetical protein